MGGADRAGGVDGGGPRSVRGPMALAMEIESEVLALEGVLEYQ